MPLTSSLDYHHGEETQKEINLAAQAVCSMDSFLELWTWNALSQPLTRIQVIAAHFSSETARLLLTAPFKGLVKLMVCATSQRIMILLPVWASMLLGLLSGFLPVVGMESTGGARSGSEHASNSDPLPSSSGSNCSQLTLKLEFSSKVVEHGKQLLKILEVYWMKWTSHRNFYRT